MSKASTQTPGLPKDTHPGDSEMTIDEDANDLCAACTWAGEGEGARVVEQCAECSRKCDAMIDQLLIDRAMRSPGPWGQA